MASTLVQEVSERTGVTVLWTPVLLGRSGTCILLGRSGTYTSILVWYLYFWVGLVLIPQYWSGTCITG